MTGRGEDLPTRDERVECFPWVICVGREGRKMGNRLSAGGDRDVFAAFRPGHKAGQIRSQCANADGCHRLRLGR